MLTYPIDNIISRYLSLSKYYSGGETLVWNDIYSGNINSELVIYGSSRAWVQFSPKIIEDSIHISAYNLGIDGHNFLMQYYRHQELLKFNKQPKYIILSVDIFTLQKKDELYNYQQFLPYLLWNKDAFQYTSSYVGFSLFDYYIPLYRYIGESTAIKASLRSLLNFKNSNPSRIQGYRGIKKDWNSDLAKAKSNTKYYQVNVDSNAIRIFENFIIECNKKKINLLLVYAPEYIEGQAFVENRNEIITIFEHFANKYNLEFINYSNDPLSSQKYLFYNSLHLNKQGAELFTNKLINDIKSLNKQSKIHKVSLNRLFGHFD